MATLARVFVGAALDTLLAEYPPASTTPEEFLGARYDAGLAWVHFEPGFGGLGLPAGVQPLVNQTLEDGRGPRPEPQLRGRTPGGDRGPRVRP